MQRLLQNQIFLPFFPFYPPFDSTMAEIQADPESIGAGPLINPTASIAPQHRDRQAFLWSRVHLSHDSINPPPRSGAASVVVQGKVSYFFFNFHHYHHQQQQQDPSPLKK